MLSLLFPILYAGFTLAQVPYSQYILAPTSRTLVPKSVYRTRGNVSNADALTQQSGLPAIFSGISSVSFDFGKNIGGLVSLEIESSSSPDAYIGVTFTESSLYVSDTACDATADAGLDDPIWFRVGQQPATYTPDTRFDRGGFRYLTLVSNTSATVHISHVSVAFTAAPGQNLRDYSGYFHSNDELLNKIWYAGAYTNQLCTIDPRHGNTLNFLGVINSGDNVTHTSWWANTTITNGTRVLTDGAKRDRLVWPGDMIIALPSIFVSTNDLDSITNGLESLLQLQKSNGMLPYAGTPFISQLGSLGVHLESFTYHLHSLGTIYDMYIFGGDTQWLKSRWSQYKSAMQWALSSIDSTGLANVTQAPDWLRDGMGGHNIEANAILYLNLHQGVKLAHVLGDQSITANWTAIANKLKRSANERLWDSTTGLYRDNETTTLHPQDGNAWAVKANLTENNTQRNTLSDALRARWGKYGAPAPEAGATVSPFASGFELEAHFLVGKAQTALDLVRLEWGFMLNDPRMTQSTFIEGYSTTGELVYAPYMNSPRISHAHGWSTAPTYALSFFAAGLRLDSALGATWTIAPLPGDLTDVDAGYSTSLGQFAVSFALQGGRFSRFSFQTPADTRGDVYLPGVDGWLVEAFGGMVGVKNGTARNVPGGSWVLRTAVGQ